MREWRKREVDGMAGLASLAPREKQSSRDRSMQSKLEKLNLIEREGRERADITKA